MGDFGTVKEWFEEVLEAYNQNLKSMNIVLFNYALDHLLRICRTLRLPRVSDSHSFVRFIMCFQGHCLLVGVGGSGKKSLTRLAAFTCGYEVFEITLTRGYGEVEFKEDLKKLYQLLGVDNKKVKSTKNPLFKPKSRLCFYLRMIMLCKSRFWR